MHSRRRQAALAGRGQAVHGTQEHAGLEGCRSARRGARGASKQRVAGGDADRAGRTHSDCEADRHFLLLAAAGSATRAAASGGGTRRRIFGEVQLARRGIALPRRHRHRGEQQERAPHRRAEQAAARREARAYVNSELCARGLTRLTDGRLTEGWENTSTHAWWRCATGIALRSRRDDRQRVQHSLQALSGTWGEFSEALLRRACPGPHISARPSTPR